MRTRSLRCVLCGKEYPLKESYACPECGGLLQVTYEPPERMPSGFAELCDPGRQGLWRYHRLLPVKDVNHIVTLGEGNTPLVKACRIYESEGVSNLYIKSEFSNPTASFKDRPTSVGISVAMEQGVKKVAVASTGNAGVSVAAYAARAGIPCVACVPQKTSPGKVSQLLAYGASVSFAPFGYSECFQIVREACELYGYSNLTSTYVNPYTVEGDKTVAYELYEQLGGRVPDCITVPVGTGPLLAGVYRGFRELKEFGLIGKLPRMIGVQADACPPVVLGYLDPEGRVKACRNMKETIAGGIADQLTGYEGDGEYTIRIVRESGGCMTALKEEEIRRAWEDLTKEEGIFAEPTSAVAVGAVKKLRSEGLLNPSDLVVALVTGHGLKAAHHAMKPVDGIPVITRPEELI